MASKKGMVADSSLKQTIRVLINNTLSAYFKDTLAKENDIENLVMALIFKESSFNVEAMGPAIPVAKSSAAKDYFYSSAVSTVYNKGVAAQMSNIDQGLRAWGLMQVMGWNFVRGGSKVGGGKTELEKARPDLAQLLVSPGESISAKYLGRENMSNQILAGLAILESKWKQCKKIDGGWQIGKVVYKDRMSCAMRGYIGLGTQDMGNGSSPITYVSDIMYGSSYTNANGPNAVYVKARPSEEIKFGPPTTIASGSNQSIPGCIKAA